MCPPRRLPRILGLAVLLPGLLSVLLSGHRPAAGGPAVLDLRNPAGGGARAARVVDPIQDIQRFDAGLGEADRRAKHCKMASSPFAFFRGTAHLFWRDLAGDPRFADFGSAHTRIWLLGDAHVDNIGFYDNDEGRVVYDVNDFDEVVIADYQWDVWRLAASIVLVAAERSNLSRRQTDRALDAFAAAYLDTLAGVRPGRGKRKRARLRDQVDDLLQRVTRSRSRKELLDAWTVLADGRRVLDLANPDLVPVTAAVAADIGARMESYVARTRGRLRKIPGYFTIKDIAARRNAGLGSLGTPRYYILIEGETGGQDDDRILDVKRQGPPSAYPYLRAEERARIDAIAESHAARSVLGYRALVADADDHLGWMRLADGDYSVRERSPYKKSLPRKALDTAADLETMAAHWGMVLASAHGRADDDHRKKLIDYSFDEEIGRITRDRRGAFLALVRAMAHEQAARALADHRAFAAFVAAQGICRQDGRQGSR